MKPLGLRDIESFVFPAIEPVLKRLKQRPIDIDHYDRSKLDSALNAPFAGFGGEEAYPRLSQKAAAYLYLVAKAHAFVDGNKRVAVVTCIYFLFRNGLWLSADPVELYKFTRKIVRSRRGIDYNIARAEAYIESHVEPLEPVLRKLGLVK